MRRSMSLKKRRNIVKVIIVLLLLLLVVHGLDDKKSLLKGKNKDSVEQILSEMTLEEKVYQMVLITPEQLTGVGLVTAAGETTKNCIKETPVGGIIYSSNNVIDKEQIKEVISNSQEYSRHGLFIAASEEGGDNSPICKKLGFETPLAMYSYRDDGKATAKANAKMVATNLSGLGFNLNLAPVSDVWSCSGNVVIGNRAYGNDYVKTATLVGEAVAGFHEGGVACSLKHFPGMGDVIQDSSGSYVILKSKFELQQQEFQTFAAGLNAGADMCMVGHIYAKQIDADLPASLSKNVVTNTLRNDFSFDGVIMTDMLHMSDFSEEIRSMYTSDEIAVLAVKAGNDMLLDPDNYKSAVQSIVKAVESGEISEAQINLSVLRILKMKRKYGIL